MSAPLFGPRRVLVRQRAEAEKILRCRDPRPTRWAELQARVDRLEALLDEHHPDWRDEEDGR